VTRAAAPASLASAFAGDVGSLRRPALLGLALSPRIPPRIISVQHCRDFFAFGQEKARCT
jgi:hypothetical protein